MEDMIREEAFDKIDLLTGRHICSKCIKRDCDNCKIREAMLTIEEALNELEAYENADLVERGIVVDTLDKELESYDYKEDILRRIEDDIPRFEPTKGK